MKLNTLKSPISSSFAALALLAAMATQTACAADKAKSTAAPATKASACKLNEKGTNPVKVKLTTSMGAITIELNKEKAPISAENFVKYVESGHYNGTVFHRVINNFMIQGGGFDKNFQQKATNPPIKNEATNGLKNETYTLAMARTGVVDSATSQFFINVNNNEFLNHQGSSNYGYAVFAKVVEGMDVVDKMKAVAVKRSQYSEAQPLENVILEKAECI
jgi:peptidyl-prolyl cis-trans isomerase B (cyclophilin B)